MDITLTNDRSLLNFVFFTGPIQLASIGEHSNLSRCVMTGKKPNLSARCAEGTERVQWWKQTGFEMFMFTFLVELLLQLVLIKEGEKYQNYCLAWCQWLTVLSTALILNVCKHRCPACLRHTKEDHGIVPSQGFSSFGCLRVDTVTPGPILLFANKRRTPSNQPLYEKIELFSLLAA